MPKIIELTVELDVQRVSCPGVWLCQDGRVSLSVYALGTSYQTCLLPPLFPLMYKDVFYFRKRYHDSCALSNMCCLLNDETIYCELVQWSENCSGNRSYTILAQYLGALNDVLFPPNTCCNDGVDLLMRRSKEFPGILSPKVEIATKVRIDEVWNESADNSLKVTDCLCTPSDLEGVRQKQVCHSAQYHRKKCPSHIRSQSRSRQSRSSRFDAGESQSCCSLTPEKPPAKCPCPHPKRNRASDPRSPRGCSRNSSRQHYNVYNMQTDACPFTIYTGFSSDCDDESIRLSDDPDDAKASFPSEDRLNKLLLESRYIDEDRFAKKTSDKHRQLSRKKLTPCVCEICKRYHELFHKNSGSTKR